MSEPVPAREPRITDHVPFVIRRAVDLLRVCSAACR
jgi:hypothetical protein